MRSTVVLTFIACLLSFASVPASAAEPEQHASVVIRASGKSGTVTRAKRAARAEQESLPAQLEGGEIPRAALQAELARGIGRFLQQVKAEPVVSRGRFMGWRLATIFPNRADVTVKALQPGDVVLRVNGQSIERPEEFMAVWASLASADQIVLDVQRGTETTAVRYTIK